MKLLAFLCATLLLTSCAVYTIDIKMADGTTANGKAIVVNNSEDVQLTVESEAFTASFGKVGTDGTVQTGIVSEVIGAAVGL